MIRPRRPMNAMNRAALAAISANPAEIAQAAMGSGSLPEYNPSRAPNQARHSQTHRPAYRERTPTQAYLPAQPGTFTSNLLSNPQKLWLHRRALWFGSAMMQITGQNVAWPPTDIPDFAETAAVLAATGLVGDDYDPITQGPTPGWSQQQFTAAYDYVVDNLASWWADAYGG